MTKINGCCIFAHDLRPSALRCSAVKARRNRISAKPLVALAAGGKHLVRIAPPPIVGGE